MRKIEIIYSENGEHKTYLLSHGPFLIGKSEVCHFKPDEAILAISVVIQQNQNGRVVITSADEKIPFIVEEKVVNSGIFNKDTFFKIGNHEFWFAFTYEQEIDDAEKILSFDKQSKSDFTEDTKKIILARKEAANKLVDITPVSLPDVLSHENHTSDEIGEDDSQPESVEEVKEVTLEVKKDVPAKENTASLFSDFDDEDQAAIKNMSFDQIPESTVEEHQEEVEERVHDTSYHQPVVVNTQNESVITMSGHMENNQQTTYINEDGFEFSINFDESGFKPVTSALYNDKSYSYDNYIEFGEDSLIDQDDNILALEIENPALHVIYMNNGVVLSEEYYDSKVKKIYISNCNESHNTFKVHECTLEKDNLSYIDGGKIMVNRQEGFDFHRSVVNGKLECIDHDFIELHTGEKVIFTKGSTQVILKKATTPPLLKKDKLFKINHEVAKYVGSALMLIFPLLFMMVLVESQVEEEKKKEVVVIYKMKKPEPKLELIEEPKEVEVVEEKVEEKVVEQPVEEPPKEVVVEEQRETKTVEKEIKQTPPKESKPKPTPTKVAQENTRVESVAEVTKPRPTVEKSVKKYSFNSASKFNALLGNKLSTAAKNESTKTNVSTSLGSISDMDSTKKVNLNSNSRTVSKMDTDGIKHGAGNGGVRGLSSKKGTNFSGLTKGASVLGAIDPEIVRRLLREHLPYFRACYQKELRVNRGLSGVFDLNFSINQKGKGVKVGIATKKKKFSKKGVSCMTQVVSMIKFPKPKGGGYVEVKQPLNFFSNKL